MSRKDYKALAELIRIECRENEQEKEKFARITADFFKADNANFDRSRYYAACGVKEQA